MDFKVIVKWIRYRTTAYFRSFCKRFWKQWERWFVSCRNFISISQLSLRRVKMLNYKRWPLPNPERNTWFLLYVTGSFFLSACNPVLFIALHNTNKCATAHLFNCENAHPMHTIMMVFCCCDNSKKKISN